GARHRRRRRAPPDTREERPEGRCEGRRGTAIVMDASNPQPPTGAGPKGAVIGAGAWGTTLSVLVGREEPVLLRAPSEEPAERLSKERRNNTKLPGIELPETIRVTTTAADIAAATDLVIVAVPSAHVREAIGAAKPFIAPSADVL